MLPKFAMNSRERVLCTLNHEEPDRVPIFFGTSTVASMLVPAYERLKNYLGVERETVVSVRSLRTAKIDEEILVRFGSDGRNLAPQPGRSSLEREINDNAFVDEWGVTWEMNPGELYYNAKKPPLKSMHIGDLDSYPWPDLTHPDRSEGLKEEARSMHEDTPYAVVAAYGVNPFERIWFLRGLDQFMVDLATDQDFAHALLRKVTNVMLAGVSVFLNIVGDYIDVFGMGDDLGTQTSTLLSPGMYRSILKPYHAEIITAIKSKTKAKIYLHSDGNIYSLIGDLIDIGVDILNPVQVSAGDMGDTARLKCEFGDKLTFFGAIDTHRVLPYGTPEEVREEVRRRINDLGHGGGYICAPVHCIQPDVPPENVCAMFEEIQIAGQYPLDI